MKTRYSKGKIFWWDNGVVVRVISLDKTDMKKLNYAVGEADRLEILNKSVCDIFVNKLGKEVRIIVKERE